MAPTAQSAYAEWGSEIVIPKGAPEPPYGACAQMSLPRCLLKLGFKGQSLDFAEKITDRDQLGISYATDFWELGEIDLARSHMDVAPYERWHLLNGQLDLQEAPSDWDLKRSGANSPFLFEYPDATVWRTQIISHRTLSDGRQRFAQLATLTSSCRACPIVGFVVKHIDINPNGSRRDQTYLMEKTFPIRDVTSGGDNHRQPDPTELLDQMFLLNAFGYDPDFSSDDDISAKIKEFQGDYCLDETGRITSKEREILATYSSFKNAPCKHSPAGATKPAASSQISQAIPLMTQYGLISGFYISAADLCDEPQLPDHVLGQGIVGNEIYQYPEGICIGENITVRGSKVNFRGECSNGPNFESASFSMDLFSKTGFGSQSYSPTGKPSRNIYWRCADTSYHGKVFAEQHPEAFEGGSVQPPSAASITNTNSNISQPTGRQSSAQAVVATPAVDVGKQCDLLAATRYNPDNPPDVHGLEDDLVEPEIAIPACRAAVAQYPSIQRFQINLATALGLSENIAEKREALEIVKKLHAAGNSLGTVTLGLYYQGATKIPDVKVDTKKARQLYEEAHHKGLPVGTFLYGQMIENGIGGSKSTRRAWDLYMQAANQGNAEAQYTVGFYYMAGGVGGRDPKKAIHWMTLAADQGFSPAQNRLGLFYSTEASVKKNPSEALRRFQQAADNRNFGALFNLAHAHAVGFAGPKKPELAAKLFIQVLENGAKGLTSSSGISAKLVATDVVNIKRDMMPKETVALVQRELTARGYYTSSIDGLLGPGTRAAMRQLCKCR